jgi:hypothetical protein
MDRSVRNERGIALPVAIFALVVVGALVAGAFFAGNQEQRLAHNAKRVTQSFGIAEVGLAEQVRQWDPLVYNQQPTYPLDSALVPDTAAPFRTGSYGGYVYKLNGSLYLMDVTGSDTASRTGVLGGGGARQRLGLLTRVRPLAIDINASLTTMGNVDVRGNAVVNGENQDPAGWNCAWNRSDTMPDVAGVRSSGDVQQTGAGHLIGNPGAIEFDPGVEHNDFVQFGDVSWNELVARANINLGSGTYRTEPSLIGGVCNRGDPMNWGDGMNPLGPCANYYPIIYINGDAHLQGVQGQGILLVQGNLTVDGSYEFFGITIIQGEFNTAGGGTADTHFWGGVLARNADLNLQTVAGRARLYYSSCAIITALQATGVTAPLRSRGWAALY